MALIPSKLPDQFPKDFNQTLFNHPGMQSRRRRHQAREYHQPQATGNV